MNNISKTYLLILIIVFMMFCCSCSRSDNTEKIDYSRFLEDQDSGMNDKTQADKAVDNNTPVPTGKITDENLTATTDKAQAESLAWNWPSDMNFTGVKSEMKDFKLGNLSTNIKINASASCLICPDTQNNVIYYMNRGKDQFIYKLEGDKSTLLVEMQAHNLQLWDNKLYFININKTAYYASGPIYSYDLETKELELVLDKSVALFNIDNFGIYYSELRDSRFNISLLDFNNKITSLADYPWVIPYNEYLLTVLEGNLSLINRNTNDIISIMPFDDAIYPLHINKDKFIFEVKKCVYVLDLLTGDKKSYNIKKQAIGGSSVESFAFIDNYIYASYETKNLVRIDVTKNEILPFYFIDRSAVVYSNLQTNGERLFASASHYDSKAGIISVIGVDEIIVPPVGNDLTRKELSK